MEAASSYRFCKRQSPFGHECSQDTFISIIERLRPSKHVIFRISKLSPKSNVDQSGERRTQSQTLLQNRDTGLQRQGKFRFIIWKSARFLNRSSRTQWTPILQVNFHFKSILKTNCQRFGYVFGMKKENQSGCAETKFQSGRVKEDSLLMEYFFLSLYMSWSDNWQLWSSRNSKSCNAKRANRVHWRRSDMFITMIIKVIKILLEHCLFLLITWYKTY